jgi:REP element-mobilizing transposase RayT
MPSHIHFIARSAELKLPGIIRDFKSHTAKAIYHSLTKVRGESRRNWLPSILRSRAKQYKQNKHFILWQKTNFPIELEYDEIFYQKLEYIHTNPVVAGYVTDPSYWNYSSANPFQRLKLIDLY